MNSKLKRFEKKERKKKGGEKAKKENFRLRNEGEASRIGRIINDGKVMKVFRYVNHYVRHSFVNLSINDLDPFCRSSLEKRETIGQKRNRKIFTVKIDKLLPLSHRFHPFPPFSRKKALRVEKSPKANI